MPHAPVVGGLTRAQAASRCVQALFGVAEAVDDSCFCFYVLFADVECGEFTPLKRVEQLFFDHGELEPGVVVCSEREPEFVVVAFG